MELPRLEREPERLQMRVSLPEHRIQYLMLRHLTPSELRSVTGIPGHAMADAPKPAVARRDQPLEHGLRAIAQHQIGMSDDSRDMTGLTITAARAHRSDAIYKLDLPDRFHVARSVGAVHGSRFDKHGLHDVVAAARVLRQFVHQVAPAFVVPYVMVRIENRQLGLERRLLAQLRPGVEIGKLAISVAAKYVGFVIECHCCSFVMTA